MKILAVDDEWLALDNLLRVIQKVEPQAEIIGLSDSEEALKYLDTCQVDIILLDIEMRGLCGLDLAKKCKELCPQVNIIFVTGYSEYMQDAFKLHVSGYLLKPVRADDLREELDNLRYPVKEPLEKRVRIDTFGHFEVYVDGKPLDIPRTKSKELLAYLIDRRGARVSVNEIASVLWEEKQNDAKTQNNVYQVVHTLMRALKKAGVQDIIIKSRRDIAIDTAKVDCDYYRCLNGDRGQMNTFAGEYMTNYSWAEFTLGRLMENQGKIP